MFDHDRWTRIGFAFTLGGFLFVKPEGHIDFTVDNVMHEVHDEALEMPTLILAVIDAGVVS